MSERSTSADADIVVLLVDDQAMIGEAVRRALAGDSGLHFHFCANPADALRTAIELQPDVILQDLVMPGIDGLSLVREYLRDPRTEGVPIIVLSSKEDPKVKSEAFAAGAYDYVVKLPDRIELIARVRHHGAAHHARRQRDAAHAALEHSERLLSQRNGELEQLNQRLAGTQTQLLQAEKMASIGQLAAGVAHEINNPIGFVRSNLGSLKRYVDSLLRLIDSYELLEDTIKDQRPELQELRAVREDINLLFLREDVEALFNETLDGIARVIKIVADLKEFSHVDQTEWQQVDLRPLLDSTLNVIGHTLRAKAEVTRDYGDLPLVECLPVQINQVFLNVLMNAIEAIPQHGEIRISAHSEGPDVVVRISDNGRGIDPAQLPRVFEPFFTTKPVGAGTGLGLSVAYGTLHEHDGSIEIQSQPGVGTEVTLRLPVRAKRFL